MDSSPPVPTRNVSSPRLGDKRPAPSLLPAFEPLSSSPSLPRPPKRQAVASSAKHHLEKPSKYPTPVPTSSTGIVASSSPPQQYVTRRSTSQRTISLLSSERAPLSTVPSLELDIHGTPTLLGRSSNSSHYQLSTNKLISRVHVRATYIPSPSTPHPNKVRVECVGWKGVNLHCEGRSWELKHGDTFTSDAEDADIMLDVHDARVLLRWPMKNKYALTTPTDTDSGWSDNGGSPLRQKGSSKHRLSLGGITDQNVSRSPLRHHQRAGSPVSPSPAVQASSSHLLAKGRSPAPVQIFEDDPSSPPATMPTSTNATTLPSSSNALGLVGGLTESQNSLLSSPGRFSSDNDEENDPLITSFGPFGSNLMPKMQSFTTQDSPSKAGRRPLDVLKEHSISPRRRKPQPQALVSVSADDAAILNHIINQLAYSRLSSTPLSTLFSNLPVHLRSGLTNNSLLVLIERTPCINAIPREGKDAAGKPLESEYYYVADNDRDGDRREAVTERLGRRGLRTCRKVHKVRYNLDIVLFSYACLARPMGKVMSPLVGCRLHGLPVKKRGSDIHWHPRLVPGRLICSTADIPCSLPL